MMFLLKVIFQILLFLLFSLSLGDLLRVPIDMIVCVSVCDTHFMNNYGHILPEVPYENIYLLPQVLWCSQSPCPPPPTPPPPLCVPALKYFWYFMSWLVWIRGLFHTYEGVKSFLLISVSPACSSMCWFMMKPPFLQSVVWALEKF